MRIIQTCPECGSDLQDIVKTSYPPKYAKMCIHCGWTYTYNDENDEVVRVPFTPPEHQEKYVMTVNRNTSDPCRNCPNDPRNGGSGVCCCTVPYLSPNSPYSITC